MAVSPTVAKQLCTKAELELFTESLSRNVKKLDAAALKSRIGRARKLREKYRQRANRQDREARGKQQPRRRRAARGSSRTRWKEQIFSQTLERFEKQLASLAAATKRAEKRAKTQTRAKKKTTKKATPAMKKAVKTKAVKAPREPRSKLPASVKKATTVAKKARRVASGRTRIDKHLSAQNRRKQAKRDAR